jgi:hypothetical protein
MWAPRVHPQLIHRLYESDAKGLIDEELIDQVGYGLLARCHSMRIVSDAYKGRVICPTCSTVVYEGEKWLGGKFDYLLECNDCDWRMTWGDYHGTFKGKQLRGLNFEPDMDRFLTRFPKAKTPVEKMLEIDRLIHAVHKGTSKPAATNLLEGSPSRLTRFLNELAYGDTSTPGLKDRKDQWVQTVRGGKYFGQYLDKPE